MRKNTGRNLIFIFGAGLLAAIAISFMIMTIKGHASNGNREVQLYYDEMESKYLKNMKGVLKEEGYIDSGITMTKIINMDGSRDYEIRIHNKNLENINDFEKDRLIDLLSQFTFDDQNCTFSHEFF